MEREFENYNKNIEEFDARNIFEYDTLKELNRKKYDNTERKKELTPKKIMLFGNEKKQHPAFN